MVAPHFLENFWVGAASFILRVYTGAVPCYSPALFPPCRVHVTRDSGGVHVAEAAALFLGSLRVEQGGGVRRRAPPGSAGLRRAPPGSIGRRWKKFSPFRRLLFCRPRDLGLGEPI